MKKIIQNGTVVFETEVRKADILIEGEKIAAISPKPQTTRTRITGIVTKEDAQLVFVDTPGIHKSKNKLGTFMNKMVRQSAGDADIILYMVDASKYNLETDSVILEGLQAPVMFLLINKTDKVDKSALLPIIDKYSKIKEFAEILPMSALEGDGLDVLVDTVKRWMAMAEADNYPALMEDNFHLMYTENYLRKYRWLLPAACRVGKPASWERFLIMARACLTHNGYERLSDIRAETLVIGGALDNVLTGEASAEIAEAIPGSRLLLYPDYGHALYQESPDFERDVLEFLMK